MGGGSVAALGNQEKKPSEKYGQRKRPPTRKGGERKKGGTAQVPAKGGKLEPERTTGPVELMLEQLQSKG